MDLDTPLTEVAHYLGREAADALLWQTPMVQDFVLRLVRIYIIDLEEKDDRLDPITLSTNLHQLVMHVLGKEEE